MNDFNDIIDRIRSAMESQGTYSPEMDMCIEICAGSYLAFKIALKDISRKNIKSFVREKSREANTKLTAHPVFKVFFDASESARKQLRELGLTVQTLSASDADEVNSLISAVEEAGKDG